MPRLWSFSSLRRLFTRRALVMPRLWSISLVVSFHTIIKHCMIIWSQEFETQIISKHESSSLNLSNPVDLCRSWDSHLHPRLCFVDWNSHLHWKLSSVDWNSHLHRRFCSVDFVPWLFHEFFMKYFVQASILQNSHTALLPAYLFLRAALLSCNSVLMHGSTFARLSHTRLFSRAAFMRAALLSRIAALAQLCSLLWLCFRAAFMHGSLLVLPRETFNHVRI